MSIYKVKEGATLSCSLGTSTSELKVPKSHGARMQGKNQATIADHVGNVNIMSFGKCKRVYPPVSCGPCVALKWINGKKDFKIGNELALLNICIAACTKGGIIKIQQSGQRE
jgi:hypothetical protein